VFDPVSHPGLLFNALLAGKFGGGIHPTNQTSLLGFGPRFAGKATYCPNIGSSGRLGDCKTVTDLASVVTLGVAIDINHDGRLDVVTTTSSASGLYVFCNDGSGFSFEGLTGEASKPMGDIATGDLDEDGYPDIVAQYQFGLVMYIDKKKILE
jgi:hypothetical protein